MIVIKGLKLKFLKISLITMVFTFLQVICYSQEDLDTGKNETKEVDSATAQPGTPKGQKPEVSEPKSGAVQRTAPKRIQVISVYNVNHRINNRNSIDKNYDSASIGDIIVVSVSNLDSLLKRSKCKDSNGNAYNNCQPQKIRLFINGRMINNIEPISGAPDKDEGTLQYRLDRNTDNDEIWADILGAPELLTDKFFVKPVKISVGLENEYAIEAPGTSDYNFQLIRIHKGWFWWCFFGLAFYIVVMYRMIKKHGLLRDRGIDLTKIGIADGNVNRPYSLGRFQMAFWFTLVIVSFLFIWLITDAYDIITASVLGLIGISAGTSLGALVIDNSKSEEVLQQTIPLYEEKNVLQAEIVDLQQQINSNPPPADLATIQTSLSDKTKRMANLHPILNKNILLLNPKKEGFVKDILSDVNGISFHRLQMFIWTLVLGLLFIYSVWKRLSMPEFSVTLLALQGLTAGTYLGFKLPEKQA